MHLYPSSPYKEQTCSTYFYTNLQIWHTMNKIRLLTKDELPKAIELSWQVFTITSKEDFNDEGLEFFKSFIYNEKYIDEKGAFDISKCDLIAYANGGYYPLESKIGKFGYSVQKKSKTAKNSKINAKRTKNKIK